MAVWLQAGALLFWLAFYTAGANAAAPQYLCGSHLVDALYLVCGPNGFFYNPKREADPLLGKEEVMLNENQRNQLTLGLIIFRLLLYVETLLFFQGSFPLNLLRRASWLNTHIKITVS